MKRILVSILLLVLMALLLTADSRLLERQAPHQVATDAGLLVVVNP